MGAKPLQPLSNMGKLQWKRVTGHILYYLNHIFCMFVYKRRDSSDTFVHNKEHVDPLFNPLRYGCGQKLASTHHRHECHGMLAR